MLSRESWLARLGELEESDTDRVSVSTVGCDLGSSVPGPACHTHTYLTHATSRVHSMHTSDELGMLIPREVAAVTVTPISFRAPVFIILVV